MRTRRIPRRLALQAGVLAGIALAFTGRAPVVAAPLLHLFTLRRRERDMTSASA